MSMERQAANPERELARRKRCEAKERERRKAYARAYERQNAEKAHATQTVRTAVKCGRLIKPDACESCGEEKRLEGHHEDYGRPLDVVWLCASCHKRLHRGLAALATPQEERVTEFERRVEIATAALCSRSSSPETRRKMRRYARRVVRALDEEAVRAAVADAVRVLDADVLGLDLPPAERRLLEQTLARVHG